MIASAKPRSSMIEAEDHVHDPDLLVVDAGEPLVPEIAPEPELGERRDERDAADAPRR